MQLIAADVLKEAYGLSPLFSGIGIVVGSLVWVFGWNWHRFWVVVGITVGGGLLGLQTGRAGGSHILALGLLLAVSSGILAMELARVLSFLAAGTAAWLAAGLVFPREHELWIIFLMGGLLGVTLFRFWVMALTSLAGVLLGWHSLLILIAGLFEVDVAAFAADHSLVLNGGVMAFTCLGILVQNLIGRWIDQRRQRRKQAEEEKKLQKEREKEREKILATVGKPEPMPTLWARLVKTIGAA